jgi:hypothetical protein
MTEQKPVIEVTELKALDVLKSIRSAWVSFVLNTDAKMKKGGRLGLLPITEATGREPDGYRKISSIVGLVGTAPDYTKLMQGRLKKHDFDHEAWVTSPRKWGKNIDGVEVQNEKEDGLHHHIIIHGVANNKPKVRYEYAGESINLSDVEKDYLPAPKKISKKQEESGLDEDTKIVHTEPDIVNIVQFTHDGTTYKIKH